MFWHASYHQDCETYTILEALLLTGRELRTVKNLGWSWKPLNIFVKSFIEEFSLSFENTSRTIPSDLTYSVKNSLLPHLAFICLFKVNNRNTRKRCRWCSKLTMKTSVFIVNLEHISHLFLLFLLFNLN